uniref:Homeobox domain-containing protein n=1 Tax=Panagrolaimus sp. JU765 TaxID=591449 RepID=A0AC34QHD8_9BILA
MSSSITANPVNIATCMAQHFNNSHEFYLSYSQNANGLYPAFDSKLFPTNSSPPSSDRDEKKIRRNRTAFNEFQLEELEKCFQNCQYPDIVIREKLSKEIHLPEPKIQVWFKNRRAKHRKHLRNVPDNDSIISKPAKQCKESTVISWTSNGPFGSFYPIVTSSGNLQTMQSSPQFQNFLSQQCSPNLPQLSPLFKF